MKLENYGVVELTEKECVESNAGGYYKSSTGFTYYDMENVNEGGYMFAYNLGTRIYEGVYTLFF